jgi:hypothetical protein
VGKKRQSLGIPVLLPASRWQPHELALLGRFPDEVVAQKLGRSVEAVQAQRFRLARQARRGQPKADAKQGRRKR